MITIPIQKNGVHLFLSARTDLKAREFHITPVLTLSWPPEEYKDRLKGFILGLEWGVWVASVGAAKKNT
jgi:hypothetical protein